MCTDGWKKSDPVSFASNRAVWFWFDFFFYFTSSGKYFTHDTAIISVNPMLKLRHIWRKFKPQITNCACIFLLNDMLPYTLISVTVLLRKGLEQQRHIQHRGHINERGSAWGWSFNMYYLLCSCSYFSLFFINLADYSLFYILYSLNLYSIVYATFLYSFILSPKCISPVLCMFHPHSLILTYKFTTIGRCTSFNNEQSQYTASAIKGSVYIHNNSN